MEPLETRLQRRMHVSLYALLFLTCLLGLSVLLEGCTDTCESEVTYAYFEPVYKTFEEIKAETKLIESQPFTTVGKIYVKDKYLFVNDPGKGIHIINNTNRGQPVIQGFLQIPGNYDLAIKGNTLYTDSYTDLVAFDIRNTQNIREVKRINNVFSHFQHDVGFFGDASKGIVTGWQERTEVNVTKGDCSFRTGNSPVICYADGVIAESASSFRASLAIAPGTGSGPGVGGSMARFTIAGDFLYTLDAGYIQPFDLSAENNPNSADRKFVAWDIESIFPSGDHLFLGASSGMHILNLKTPQDPQLVSTYQHIRSCDPVVVQDQYAYVTLRSGTECQGFANQLEVIDISNLASPQLLNVYPMSNPHGLGIDNNLLFICDGASGLKVYDAADINNIDQNLLKHYDTIDAFDVIPLNNLLIMVGQDGVFQYDYSNPKNINLLSHIAIK